MPNASTSQLRVWIEECRKGNATAKEQLLEHTNHRIQILARKLLQGRGAFLREETGDVAQETYVKILERWDNFIQPKNDPEADKDPAKLFFERSARIIRDVLCDMMRSQFGRDGSRPRPKSFDEFAPSPNDSQGAYDPGQSTHNPENLAVWTEIQEFIDAFPDDIKAVVDLHWFHELTHAEVGEVLGIAEGTSRLRWTKARVQLATKFPDTQFA